jgi:hypothetical protein
MKINISDIKEYSCGNTAIKLTIDNEDAVIHLIGTDYTDELINTLRDLGSDNNARKLMAYKRTKDNNNDIRYIEIKYLNKNDTTNIAMIMSKLEYNKQTEE